MNKRPITTSEAGKLGGKARMKKLSKKRRHEIAMKAGLANKARLARMKQKRKSGWWHCPDCTFLGRATERQNHIETCH